MTPPRINLDRPLTAPTPPGNAEPRGPAEAPRLDAPVVVTPRRIELDRPLEPAPPIAPDAPPRGGPRLDRPVGAPTPEAPRSFRGLALSALDAGPDLANRATNWAILGPLDAGLRYAGGNGIQFRFRETNNVSRHLTSDPQLLGAARSSSRDVQAATELGATVVGTGGASLAALGARVAMTPGWLARARVAASEAGGIVDRMPLAGKAAVQFMMKRALGTREPAYRVAAHRDAAIFNGFMVGAHVWQADLGIRAAFTSDANRSPEAKALQLSYGLVNAAAATRQLALMGRAISGGFQAHRQVVAGLQATRYAREPQFPSWSRLAWPMAFTLGASAAVYHTLPEGMPR